MLTQRTPGRQQMVSGIDELAESATEAAPVTTPSAHRSKNHQSLQDIADRVHHVAPSQESSLVAREYVSARAQVFLHSFQYDRCGFLLDPVHGAVFSLTPDILPLAQALSEDIPYDLLAQLVETCGAKNATAFLRDITRLALELGMFAHVPASDTEHDEAFIEQYLRHHPRKAMLCVTQTCNLRCVYCYAIDGNYIDEGRRMTLETAQQAIRFIVGRSGRRRALTVTLFGGEPLINYDMLVKLVPWAKEWAQSQGKRLHFTITTNGMLLSDEIIDFLIATRMSIMVSLDGPKGVHDYSRPCASGRGSFDIVAPRFKALLERHPYPQVIKVRATMTHESHDTEALARFFAGFGFRRIALGASLGFAFDKSPHDLTADDRDEVFEASERFVREALPDVLYRGCKPDFDPVTGGLVALHRVMSRAGPNTKVSCGVGRNDQGIDADGNVYPCHRYVGLAAYRIGDVWHGVNEQKARAYYSQLLAAYRQCATCWASYWCGGNCPYYLSRPEGALVSPDPLTCDGIRRSVQRSIALYVQHSKGGADWETLARDFPK